MILIGSLALMGFPYLTGFYSKDILLELNFGTYHFSGLYAYWLGTLSAFFTSFYSIRLIFMTFYKSTNASNRIIKNVHESSFIMLIPLIVLCFGSVFVGFIFKDLFIGMGVDTWNTSLFQLVNHISFYEAEFLSFKIKLIPLIFSLNGLFLAIFVFKLKKKYFSNLIIYKKYYYIYKFFSKKWYFDNIYSKYIVNNGFYLGYYVSFKVIDRGLLELIGPFGFIQNLKTLINRISNLQSGFIYHYALAMGLSLFFFIFIFSLPSYLTVDITIIVLLTYLSITLSNNNK